MDEAEDAFEFFEKRCAFKFIKRERNVVLKNAVRRMASDLKIRRFWW